MACRYKRTIIQFCFLLILTCAVSAESFRGDGLPMTVATFQENQIANQTLGSIVQTAVMLELQREGFAVDNLSDRISAPGDIEDVYELSQSKQADVLFVSIFELRGETISLKFSVHDLSEEKKLTEITRSGNIDLTLDTVISQSVEEAMTSESVKTYVETRLTQSATDSAITDERQGQQERSSDTKGAGETASSSGNQTSTAGESPSSDPTGTKARVGGKPKPVEIAIGFAPFLTTGNISAYTDIGYVPSLSVSFRVDLKAVLLGFGLFSSFTYFNAVSAVTQSTNYLIPIGAEIKLLSGGVEALTMHIRAAGGAAILFIKRATGQEFMSTLPFVSGGVGGSIAVSRNFGFTIDASYLTVFDSSSPIMGFTPSLYLFIRF